jgi:S1-C subfamily serine protease
MRLPAALRTFVATAAGAAIGASAMLVFADSTVQLKSPAPAIAGGEDDQQRIIEAVKHVEPSVVALDVDINGTRVVPSDPFASMFGQADGGGRLMPFHEAASGSGFVYSRSGLIVTNDHVVHGASKIDVVFANGDRVPAKIYAEDSAADLALVRVDDYAKLPRPVDFGSSNDVRQGEWAIAIGEPFALKQTVTVGVVSGFNRNETIGGDDGVPRAFKNLLQTSAPINPGNSGGPLVDLEGRVIGVNQSVAQPAQDIGFAIPVDTVKGTVAMLAQHPGSALTSSAGFLGVELESLTAPLRSQLSYAGPGAVVVGVVGGSPADQAGLQPGDVIQSVNGTPIAGPADATGLIAKIAPGRTATLRVWSNGWRKLVGVKIASRPSASD